MIGRGSPAGSHQRLGGDTATEDALGLRSRLPPPEQQRVELLEVEQLEEFVGLIRRAGLIGSWHGAILAATPRAVDGLPGLTVLRG